MQQGRQCFLSLYFRFVTVNISAQGQPPVTVTQLMSRTGYQIIFYGVDLLSVKGVFCLFVESFITESRVQLTK